jgi:hypothetical protein
VNGEVEAAERALAGAPVSAAGGVLGGLGKPGRELAAALAGAVGRL